VPSITSFPSFPEGGGREPCPHQGLQSHRQLALAPLRLNHGTPGDSFKGGGVGGEHNPKYKTKNPEAFS